ncbi:MAG: hypothetical protein ACK4K5_10430 [Thermosynechococcus sp.]|uniref:High light inducible protein n=1 Tax=Thermosynechococcus sichuanensis E542 TaxID=2016101 RepID=A0A3B7ME07_9CYAN|nr:hypothetical protein [Thermosynechococcus vestitus]AXY67835.1 hypothetical protein D3A95_05950 [Thermosynechococcus vestitus E542]
MATPTEPSRTPKLETPKYGFNTFAERMNGRAAMVGLVALLLWEYWTGEGLLHWLGWV